MPDQDILRQKTIKKCCAPTHTLYKPAARTRVVAETIAGVSGKRRAGNLDTARSGPLLRFLCHHAHMLANHSVSREYCGLPQIKIPHVWSVGYGDNIPTRLEAPGAGGYRFT